MRHVGTVANHGSTFSNGDARSERSARRAPGRRLIVREPSTARAYASHKEREKSRSNCCVERHVCTNLRVLAK